MFRAGGRYVYRVAKGTNPLVKMIAYRRDNVALAEPPLVSE